MKRLVCSRRIFTCWNSSALTAADSSLEAELFCTTWEIWLIPSVTWAMDSASPCTASAITLMELLESRTSSRVVCRVWDTSSTIWLPRWAALMEFSISSRVAFAA